MSARDTSIKTRDNIDARIANALERIAAALEQANTVRAWPTMQPLGGTAPIIGGWTCTSCRTWVPNGTTHYCTIT